ncbi:hypothetical protein Lalb_Chr01g0019291 [Lupinus albus]|uniref:Uncharacterized protein n=1 Tax=Lupinus albus TaxID=3870 RepID=A0A6A4R9T1_LUPAL|nr:hypothetical protein Lalb_Chr01g0019291 [Lupinus albus]
MSSYFVFSPYISIDIDKKNSKDKNTIFLFNILMCIQIWKQNISLNIIIFN